MITARQLAKLDKDVAALSEKSNSIEKTLGEINDKLDEVLKQNANVVNTTNDKTEERPEETASDKAETGPTIS